MAALEDLDEDFILCNVCNAEYDEDRRSPKLLPCLHTVCASCIQPCFKGNALKCAICQEEHQTHKYSELLKDSTMRNMMDLIRLHKKSSAILCSDCPDDGTGETFCKDCYVFLCKECTSAHKRTQITRRHTVASIDSIKQSGPEIFNRKEMCSLPGHEDQTYSFYCDEKGCQKPICMQCVVAEHSQANGHAVRNLAEVYEENKHLVEQMVTELWNKISGVCNDMKSLESEGGSLDDKYSALNTQIDSLFDKMDAMLKERREVVKHQVNDVFSRRKEEVVQQHHALQKVKADMENSCNYSSRLMFFTNPSEFLQLKGLVLSRMGHLIDSESESVSFKPVDLQLKPGVDEKAFQEYLSAICIVDTGSPRSPQEVVRQNHVPIAPMKSVTTAAEKPVMDTKPVRQTSLENTRSIPTFNGRPAFDGSKTFPMSSSNIPKVPLKSPSSYKAFNPKAELESLRLEGISDDREDNSVPEKDVNHKGPSSLLTKPISLEPKQPSAFNKVTQKPAPNPPESNVLGRPLSLKSPVIQTTKKPTSLGEFLKSADLPAPAPAVSENSPVSTDKNPRINGEPAAKPPSPTYADVKQTTPAAKTPPSDKPVAFGDITCPEFFMDPASAHHEREVSSDGRSLRNKKVDIFTSSSTVDLENSLVQYKGAIGNCPFKDPGRFYYEVDVNYNIQQPLEETWLVFEIGICRLDDIDMHHTVERHVHARSFYVARYPENGMLAQEFWHNRDLLSYSLLSENTAGLEVRVTYGLLVDTRRKKWTVVDSGKNKVLHTFDMLDFSEALYPVFGCYNPDLITVEMTLKTGSEITLIPQCLKSGYIK